jgi:glycosyltransferase involved in cell wall biosynthesis
VVIPSIAVRRHLLKRAFSSAVEQILQPECIIVEVDRHHQGAWATRNAGMAKVETTWTAFLDDDDELRPEHLRFLMDRVQEEDLDIVWGWFQVIGGQDPFPMHRGKQYDLAEPHIVPITYMCRTELLRFAVRDTGGFQPDDDGSWDDQDQPLFHRMCELGKSRAYPDITWDWHHHGSNTSGLPSRW